MIFLSLFPELARQLDNLQNPEAVLQNYKYCILLQNNKLMSSIENLKKTTKSGYVTIWQSIRSRCSRRGEHRPRLKIFTKKVKKKSKDPTFPNLKNVTFSSFPGCISDNTIFPWVCWSSRHRQNGTTRSDSLDCRIRSFLRRTLGDRDSTSARWDRPAYLRRPTGVLSILVDCLLRKTGIRAEPGFSFSSWPALVALRPKMEAAFPCPSSYPYLGSCVPFFFWVSESLEWECVLSFNSASNRARSESNFRICLSTNS